MPRLLHSVINFDDVKADPVSMQIKCTDCVQSSSSVCVSHDFRAVIMEDAVLLVGSPIQPVNFPGGGNNEEI